MRIKIKRSWNIKETQFLGLRLKNWQKIYKKMISNKTIKTIEKNHKALIVIKINISFLQWILIANWNNKKLL